MIVLGLVVAFVVAGLIEGFVTGAALPTAAAGRHRRRRRGRRSSLYIVVAGPPGRGRRASPASSARTSAGAGTGPRSRYSRPVALTLQVGVGEPRRQLGRAAASTTVAPEAPQPGHHAGAARRARPPPPPCGRRRRRRSASGRGPARPRRGRARSATTTRWSRDDQRQGGQQRLGHRLLGQLGEHHEQRPPAEAGEGLGERAPVVALDQLGLEVVHAPR